MKNQDHPIEMFPIGKVMVDSEEVPRHWSVSDLEGLLVIDRQYTRGLQDLRPGQRITVIFQFHRSPAFTTEALAQTPPHSDREMGVFSICSPLRPNPLGSSVLEILEIRKNSLRVRGLDMLNETPILDIKPHIES